jgi:D-lactate dehydrogenase
VLITGHQAFLTDHALRNIADTTLDNFTSFHRTGKATHAVTLEETRG